MPPPPPVPAPAPTGSGGGRPTVSKPDTGAALALAGGVLVVIGVFLPWVHASNGLATVSHNGIDIGTYGTLILGALAAARAFASIRGQSSPFTRGNSMITGGLILGLVALRWSTLQTYLTDERAVPGVTASIGLGVWAVILGGLLVLAGGALSTMRQRAGG
jgi:hypothetical protein